MKWQREATSLRGSNWGFFVRQRLVLLNAQHLKFRCWIKRLSDFLALSDCGTICFVRNKKTQGGCPEWLRLLGMWRSKHLNSFTLWLCNLDAHAKEKYQKVMLFLTIAGATKLWEQFRCLHIGALCHFRHCRASKSDHSTLNHSLGIFNMFQLILVKEAKNETAGMVTSPAQLSHTSWAKNYYLALYIQSSSFRSYHGNRKSNYFFKAQRGGM